MQLGSHQLLNVNAHKIAIINSELESKHMIEPGLAFVSTGRPTNFRTLVRILLYGHVVHVSSCSLVLVSRHKRIVTVGEGSDGD
jgi:hypothetical protein